MGALHRQLAALTPIRRWYAATPQIRDLSSFLESWRKGERASIFHSDRERQLRSSRFTPFVESVCWNQSAALDERLAE